MSTSEHTRGGDDAASLISSQTYRVVVGSRTPDASQTPAGRVIEARQLGITALLQSTESRLYFLRGTLSASDARQIATELLTDPVTEQFDMTLARAHADAPAPSHSAHHTIEVTLLPGVTDPAAENLMRAALLLGIEGLDRAATGHRYELIGQLSQEDLARLATGVLSNPVIQRYAVDALIEPPFFAYHKADQTIDRISLRQADDNGLLKISAERRLALDLAEMQAIRAYYQSEQRDPTDVELEMIAQTWSEHCVHKTFSAVIECVNPDGAASQHSPEPIDGLLRTYIRAATERVNKPWVLSAFVDNAGIVAFDDNWDLAFKVETHNHPSALEPFGGANTGVGGVIRDIIGVSARPIANTDVLCFGPQDMPAADVPSGVLHPRRVFDGVVRGVEDYGNKMGIPTVNGAILYHPGYTANPLVFCGCLGLLPHGSHPTTPCAGDLVIVIGGRTGRDGLRGATFSSMEMDQATSDIAGTAVQIGHPIHEKQAMEAVLLARDAQLYSALTDCGAGGLSSAVGELARSLGARIDLATVPLKYPGLRPWEIWLSEAQERMVLAVPPDNWLQLKAICDGLSIEAVCIGSFEDSARLRLYYEDSLVADLDMHFLHDGIPRRQLQAWADQKRNAAVERHSSQPSQPAQIDMRGALLKLLAHPDIRSKESVIRLYDHEVQGGTVVKPLTGALNHGPSDAAVVVPQAYLASAPKGACVKGVALSNGICPSYTELDPYAMAWAAIDEAMRNAVAVGADPDQVSLLDNFCWGNPNLPDRLGSLVQCAQGCYDAAIAFNAPFISGKDSLNNEYTASDGRKHAIPGTLLISAMGIVPDIAHTVTMDLKQAGNTLYVVGETRDELGGSHFTQLPHRDSQQQSNTLTDSPTPQPVINALAHMRRLHTAISAGLVRACHDASEGGLGVALAEMCLAGQLGATIDLAQAPGARDLSDAVTLFSESLCRFIVEVASSDRERFETLLADTPFARVGEVTSAETDLSKGIHCSESLWENNLQVIGHDQSGSAQIPVAQLDAAWHSGEVSPSPRDSRQSQKEEGIRGQGAGVISKGQSYLPSTLGRPRVLILHATGTNRDHDAAIACELAGGAPEIVHVNQLIAGERNLLDYAMLVVPGGFSYGDDLGAGTLWAMDLHHRLSDVMARFVAERRPVLGICNGFQALVKSNLLPGIVDFGATAKASAALQRPVTLAPNTSGRFECRWVYLKPNPASKCIFTTGLSQRDSEQSGLIYCPVAHGEGRVAVGNDAVATLLQTQGLIALSYVDAAGNPAQYPENPNGSLLNIAGLTNQFGNVLGLMPHPENHIFDWQHPRSRRSDVIRGMRGLCLFENGIQYARSL